MVSILSRPQCIDESYLFSSNTPFYQFVSFVYKTTADKCKKRILLFGGRLVWRDDIYIYIYNKELVIFTVVEYSTR